MLSLLHFLGEMSVSKHLLYSMWHNENVAANKFLVLKEYVFGTIFKNTKISKKELEEIEQKLASFVSRLTEKWKACQRNKSFFWEEKQEMAWYSTLSTQAND